MTCRGSGCAAERTTRAPYATLAAVVSKIWVLLLAIALVSATAQTASDDLGSAEIVELETALDDLIVETVAPVLPELVRIDSRTAHDAIPTSQPVVQVFRPPRSAS